MDKSERKKVQSIGNKIGWGLIVYTVIMYIVVVADFLIKIFKNSKMGFLEFMTNETSDAVFEATLDECLLSGTASIISVVAGVAFLLVFFIRNIKFKQVWAVEKRMKASDFFKILTVFMAGQFIFSLLAMGIENGLNLMGLTAMDQMDTATGVSTTVSMFLYAGIIGPIAEEIVYRGFVMNLLKPYGKRFAIVVSSIFFGVMHANVHQLFFAFVVGLVFAYVASEYSLKWSIGLHIFNNCVFGDLFSYAISGFSQKVQDIILFVVELLFFVGGIVILIIHRKDIKSYFKEKENKKNYLRVFLTAGVLIFILANLAIACGEINKL